MIFLKELDFLTGDTNIYSKQITFFERATDFVKTIHIFFLKIYFYFNLVLLHLNNHKCLALY